MTGYAKEATLKDGRKVSLRYLGREDFELSLDFFRRQPEEERVYLRRDVTRREVIEERIGEIEAGLATVIVALDGGRIIGDAMLFVLDRGWFRKTGEIRLTVDTEYRGLGLGTLLAREIFALAVKKELVKLEIACMEMQVGTMRVLEPFGFVREGLLPNFVVDIRGREHDLILMGMRL